MLRVLLCQCNGLAIMYIVVIDKSPSPFLFLLPLCAIRWILGLTRFACAVRVYHFFQLHTYWFHSHGLRHPQQQPRRSHAVRCFCMPTSAPLRCRLTFHSLPAGTASATKKFPQFTSTPSSTASWRTPVHTLMQHIRNVFALLQPPPHTSLSPCRRCPLHRAAPHSGAKRLERHWYQPHAHRSPTLCKCRQINSPLPQPPTLGYRAPCHTSLSLG